MKTYLMLKDIFPQNAVDLGLLRRPAFYGGISEKREEVIYDFRCYRLHVACERALFVCTKTRT